MNDRERFLATMNYQPRDRAPICDFGFWPETIEKWHSEGLPAWVGGGHNTTSTDEFFGMDRYACNCGPSVGLCPGFPTEVVEDRGDQHVIRDGEGVLKLQHKTMSSIPIHLGHTLVDRESWEKQFKPRLDPDTPERWGRDNWNLKHWKQVWADDSFAIPRVVGGGSLFGWIRNWMGIENVSYLVYDDPALFEEMIETLCTLTCEMHRRAFELGARFDACSMWEDMCYNAGPLLGVEHFKKYLVPRYRRITDQLRAHGCEIVWNDCDGKIDDLIPHWLDGGVNCLFPIEVGTWGGDPVRYRQEYGRQLLMMGGFDKHILAQSKEAITAEVDRLTPTVEDGAFIPFCDHRVPPDVPLENYMHYLREARAKWGLNHETLKPMGELEPVAAR